MAKTITRQTLNLFGNAGASTNFAEFGSQAAGAPVKTKNIATIQALAAYAQGWQNAVALGNAPYLEDMNSLFYLLAYQVVYGFQEGIAEYDAGTTYFIGSVVKKPGTFELYGSLVDDNTGNALGTLASTANWQYLGKLSDFQNLQNSYSNILANGGFEYWFYGTSFSNPGNGVIVPGWNFRGGAAVTVSRETTIIDGETAAAKILFASTQSGAIGMLNYILPGIVFVGRTLSVSMKVRCNVGSVARVAIDDGVGGVTYSSYHTGSGAYETLTVTRTISAGSTGVSIYVGAIQAGDVLASTIYVDSAMAVWGSTAVSYLPTQRNQDILKTGAYAGYRRPSMVWVNGTLIQLLDNQGISGAVQVLFPDGDLRAGFTNNEQQLLLTQTAVITTPGQQGGLRSGESLTNNTWLAVYAVKVGGSTTAFVTVATQTLPLVANKLTLDNAFGSNSFVYIGMLRYGDNRSSNSGIVRFDQNGSSFRFRNALANPPIVATGCGVNLFLSAGINGGAATYTYSAGTGSVQIPNHIAVGTFMTIMSPGAAGTSYCYLLGQQTGMGMYIYQWNASLLQSSIVSFSHPCAEGLNATSLPGNSSFGMSLTGWEDPLLIGKGNSF